MSSAKAETVVSDLPESPKVQSNPNYCFRKVKKTNGLGKQVDAICGGAIIVQTIEMQKDGSALVTSKCGGCEAVETETFTIPREMKHSESCMLAQKKGLSPVVYLQTVIPRHVWKCAGCPEEQIDEAEESTTKYVMCDGLVIDSKKGYPF